MRTHELKVWPEFFEALENGSKPFEIRKDDRGFMVGDELYLREWDPAKDGPTVPEHWVYTGREMRRTVTYKFAGGRYGIPEGICILGLSRATRSPGEEGR